MHDERKALIFALSAVLLWSTVATAFKITLRYMSPIQMLAAASVVSVVILLAIATLQGKLGAIWPTFRARPGYYLVLGLVNPLIYYLVLFKAYDLLPASLAQPLNYSWAITLTLMAALFLGQTIRRQDWIAAALGYFGVVIIATKGQLFSLQFDSPLGIGLALLSTLLWAGYWILNTKNAADPVVGILLSFVLSLPISLTLAGLTASWQGIPWQGWLAVSYVGLFEMGVTFMLWLSAMKYTQNTSRISNLIFISPFISLLLLATIIGETIHLSTLIGLMCIVVGLLIQQRTGKRDKPSAASASS
ncbi:MULTISPECIES: DMT family transporter [unclassified Salinivibrio]|uniref:DMT family transporter n=1 Tax=unclassified Salinivibrio TaxID=2636825 RepID=UPI0009846E7B|nr:MULTISPECIES: DMT family transporter [unclassified Salinivibrio]MPS33605.1 DMT family transporter [Salinivibrio sp. VYel7]MPX92055.1 DMT family transporter [Salinivibrio sp. VYel1]MPX94988.1 DMT family transporter [Salinivibrio sp. VYel9]MPX96623.1 DMT family transporter [Salinivibrio sp. VYel6]MPY00232.1 DMT family transporter [Salinivibrio sp. VYel4]